MHWFPQLARALTSEKADYSLFNHRGNDHPGCCSGSGPLFLLLRSLCRQGWEGPQSPLLDPEHTRHDLPPAGLHIGQGTPQELSQQGGCQAPAGIPAIPPTPTLGSATPWAPQRDNAHSHHTPPSCGVLPRLLPQGAGLHCARSG